MRSSKTKVLEGVLILAALLGLSGGVVATDQMVGAGNYWEHPVTPYRPGYDHSEPANTVAPVAYPGFWAYSPPDASPADHPTCEDGKVMVRQAVIDEDGDLSGHFQCETVEAVVPPRTEVGCDAFYTVTRTFMDGREVTDPPVCIGLPS